MLDILNKNTNWDIYIEQTQSTDTVKYSHSHSTFTVI